MTVSAMAGGILRAQKLSDILRQKSLRETMAIALRSIVFTSLRWGCAWAVIGLLVGVSMMFFRVPPIAEPGAPSNFGFYSFWIPACLGIASLLGLLLGFIYACLMAAIDLWRLLGEAKPSFTATYLSGLFCGAVAGGMVGWPMMHDWSALWIVGLGTASAMVSGFVGLNAKKT